MEGETEVFRTSLIEIWGKLQTLPPSKISDILRVGGRTVISGVPNVGGIDFGRAHGSLEPMVYECLSEAVETGVLVKLQTYPGLDLWTSGQ